MKKKSKKDSNKKMLDAMYKRYGTQINFIEVDIHMTESEVIKHCGTACEDYERGCPVCDSWDQWRRTGTVKVLLYRDDVIKMINS
jgi:hypothetical protein